MKEQGAEEKKRLLKSFHKETGYYISEQPYVFAKWYHRHRLNAITDEDIERMFPINSAQSNDTQYAQCDKREGAKALLNSLKGIQ